MAYMTIEEFQRSAPSVCRRVLQRNITDGDLPVSLQHKTRVRI